MGATRRVDAHIQAILVAAFTVFLLVTFVGVEPLSQIERLELEEGGAGDRVRQALILATTALLGGSFIFLRPERISVFSVAIVAALSWFFLSVVWSAVPDIAFRRVVYTTAVVISVYSAASMLGPALVLKVFFYSILGMVAASLAAGLVFPTAVHRLSDPLSGALLGNWRGVFPHKNQAGIVSAILIVMATYNVAHIPAWARNASLIAATCLLILAGSKTAILLVIPAIVLGLVFASRRSFGFFTAFFFVVVLPIGALVVILGERVLGFTDLGSFSGRTTLWTLLLQIIASEPLRGVGYGSIFLVGDQTPLLRLGEGWVLLVPYGHNGYLDLMASTGAIGLAFACWALIADPIRGLIAGVPQRLEDRRAMISLMVLALAHNLTETTLFYRGGSTFIVLLLVAVIIRLEASGIQELRQDGQQPNEGQKARTTPASATSPPVPPHTNSATHF